MSRGHFFNLGHVKREKRLKCAVIMVWSPENPGSHNLVVSRIFLESDRSAVLLIDVQPTFLNGMWEAPRVLRRCEFLLRAASSLGVPTFASVQNSERMGGLDDSLKPLVASVFNKHSFSCLGSADIAAHLIDSGRNQILLVGIETHICVGLTANELLQAGYEVAVCPDAVSAGSMEMHKLGMERVRDAGAVPVHSEGAVYEWMRSSNHPKFREVLSLVKSFRT